VRGEYRAYLVQGQARIAWKEQFIRVAGAEEAARIAANAERPLQLKVDRIATAAAVKRAA